MVSPAFFSWSLNLAVSSWSEFMTWATVSSWSCFCWLYRASPSLAAKNIINLILVLTIWWCPCVESSLVLLEKIFWRYNSHTIQFTHWKCTVQWFLVYSHRGETITTILENFHNLTKKLCALDGSLPDPPVPTPSFKWHWSSFCFS